MSQSLNTHHFRIKRSSARIVHRLESIKPESSRSKSELESIKPESSRSKQSFMVYHHFSTIHLHSNIYFLEISFYFKHVRLALSHVYHTWFYVHIINILLSAFISYLHNISIFLSATSFILAKISSIPKIQKITKKITKLLSDKLFIFNLHIQISWMNFNSTSAKSFWTSIISYIQSKIFFSLKVGVSNKPT